MPETCSSSRSDAEAGFALVSALWLSLALGLVGSLSLALAWRAVVRAELLVSEVAEAAAVEGAMIRAIHDLGRAPTQPVPFLVSYTINDREITVEARPTTAWPDLNHIDAVSLANFLEVLGASPSRAARLADTIADWREPAGSRRLNAATLSDYEAAGLPPPAHRPFESTADLSLIAGLPPQEAQCLGAHVTVFAESHTTDVAVAAHPALRAGIAAPAYAPLGVRWTLTAGEGDGVHAWRSSVLLASSPENPVLVFQWMDEVPVGDGRCFGD